PLPPPVDTRTPPPPVDTRTAASPTSPTTPARPNPSDPDAATQALSEAASLENAGDFNEALRRLQRALQLDPARATAVEQQITRLRDRMKREGTEALTKA